MRTGFGSAVYFTSLNSIRQQAARVPFLAAGTSGNSTIAVVTSGRSSSLPQLSRTGNLMAGAVARAFAGFLLMPLTVIKVRYESSLYSYASVAGAAKDIYRGEGLRGFFAGFGATAVRDAPYAGLYVLFYEESKKRLSAVYSEKGVMGMSRAATINFASGVAAGTVCSVVSNPFDAVKTRIQLQPGKYRNMVHAARRMLAEEGFRSMWDGLALRMSRKALSSALAWTAYEELIRRAENTWNRTAKGGSVI
jgi:solute carrier family 25 protein 38